VLELPQAVILKGALSSFTGFGGGSPSIQSNNLPAPAPGTDRLNGGLSVVGMASGDQLAFTGLMPPEPLSTSTPLNNFRYRCRLRVSNAGSGNATITTVINQGTMTVTRSFTVAPTGNAHEYVMVDDGNGYSTVLVSGTVFSLSCAVGSAGPCAIDDIVLESEGNGF
jgi:hypothetical protein